MFIENAYVVGMRLGEGWWLPVEAKLLNKKSWRLGTTYNLSIPKREVEELGVKASMGHTSEILSLK